MHTLLLLVTGVLATHLVSLHNASTSSDCDPTGCSDSYFTCCRLLDDEQVFSSCAIAGTRTTSQMILPYNLLPSEALFWQLFPTTGKLGGSAVRISIPALDYMQTYYNVTTPVVQPFPMVRKRMPLEIRAQFDCWTTATVPDCQEHYDLSLFVLSK